MAILSGDILTPNKKETLISAVKEELMAVSDYLKNKQFGDAALTLAQRNQKALQDQLNLLLEKRGVITPDETSKALSALDISKRERLKEDYLFGVKKTTLYLLGAVAIAYGTWFYFKKYRK